VARPNREVGVSKAVRHWHRKWRWQRVTQLMARDGLNCTICGEALDRHLRDERHPRYITFDHKVPRAHGGNDSLANLRLAHRHCNGQRGTDPIMPEDEAGERSPECR
jgi:5-methylcytosine-specific restriction endonuclease McrA